MSAPSTAAGTPGRLGRAARRALREQLARERDAAEWRARQEAEARARAEAAERRARLEAEARARGELAAEPVRLAQDLGEDGQLRQRHVRAQRSLALLLALSAGCRGLR